MIFNFIRARWVLLLFALVAITRPARADEGDSPDVEAQRLNHILGYISADYGATVAGGTVVNLAEYDEQLSLLADAEKIAKKLTSDPRAGAKLAPAIAE